MSFVKKFIEPPEAQPPCYETEEEMKAKYKYWRFRQLYATFIGYAVYYFVRKNIALAVPLMTDPASGLGLTKADMGKVMSFGDVVYGVSKSFNGFLGDRCNPRYFMAFGLLMSALANFFFGMNTTVGVLILFWCLNGWFQGMGAAPCSRVITHWYHAKERGVYWGIWNTSHQVGLSIVLVMAGYLGEYMGWQYIFWVPAALAGLTSLFLLERLRDTPASLGLPEPEVYTGEQKMEEAKIEKEEKQTTKEFFHFLCHNVFNNPALWMICIANFLIYVLRYGFVNWAPAFLTDKGINLANIGWMVAGFEIAGLCGSLLAGWITDRFFAGQRSPVCVAYMLLSTLAIYGFWKIETNNAFVYGAMLLLVGFLIYGPQMLVAVMATDLATKKAAATAVGMTGLFGYASGIVSGWGLGHVLDHYGWDQAFMGLVICSAVTIIPFICCWNAKPRQVSELNK